MRLYLDDDSTSSILIRMLRQAGHDVLLPIDLGLKGAPDPVHLRHAIEFDRVLLTRNHDDFEHLHLLLRQAAGRHAGVIVVRRDNDPRRDMRPPHVVRALRNLENAGTPVADQFIILNHWR